MTVRTCRVKGRGICCSAQSSTASGENGSDSSSDDDCRFWCVSRDWCGVFCAFFAWFTVIFVDYGVVVYVLNRAYGGSARDSGYYWFHIAIFELLCFLTLVAHLRAMISDPGVIPYCIEESQWWTSFIKEKENELGEGVTMGHHEIRALARKKGFCVHCKMMKPRTVHHCSTCKRCVLNMDHHCPWVNNCVGKANLRFFLQFLCYVFLASLYAILLMVWRFYSVVTAPPPEIPEPLLNEQRFIKDSQGRIVRVNPTRRKSSFSFWPPTNSAEEATERVVTAVVLIISFILALIFAIFVGAMLWDQYEALTSGVAGIDAMKGVETEEAQQSVCEGLRQNCDGGRFTWRWFFPFHSHPMAGKGFYTFEEVQAVFELNPPPPDSLSQNHEENGNEAPSNEVPLEDSPDGHDRVAREDTDEVRTSTGQGKVPLQNEILNESNVIGSSHAKSE